MASLDLSYIAAPMVNQSDLPFRILVRRYNASLVYTQMLLPDRLLHDQEYLEFHRRSLRDEQDTPVVVQLCGNDPEVVDAAREGHYGGYLLEKKDWPLVESIVSALSRSLPVPVSTKIRLCQNTALTADLGVRLAAAGSSWITLHARHVSARRRRQGAADLEQVRVLKERVGVPVVSNGNVRTWEDVCENRTTTGADGVMVGETLLANPCLFANATPDPVKIALEYLEMCREHPGTATVQTVQTHVRHFVDHQCGRRPWFSKFRAALGRCESIDAIEKLLRVKVQRWRGLPPLSDVDAEDEESEEGDAEERSERRAARDCAAGAADVDAAFGGLNILS